MFNLICSTCGMDQFVEGARAEAEAYAENHAHPLSIDIVDVA